MEPKAAFSRNLVVRWLVPALVTGCALPPLPGPDAGVCGCLPRPDSCEGMPLHPICEFADAGHDGGRRDAPLSDAPYMRDAPPFDSPWGAEDPGWVYLDALPAECDVQVASHPERIVAPGTWVADCGPGCLRRDGGDVARFAGVLDGVPMLVTRAGLGDDESPFAYWVFTELTTGRSVAAFRDARYVIDAPGTPRCVVGGWGAGAGAVVVAVAYWDYDETGSRVESEWLSVLRAELGDRPERIRSTRHDDSGGPIGAMVVSATHVGFVFGRYSPVLVSADGEYVYPSRGTGDTSETVHLAMVRGSDLFWEAERHPTVLVRSVGGATPVVAWAVAGGDVRGFATDGTDLAWLQARGWDEDARAYASVSLWTATYDGIGFVSPHRVADVQGHEEGVVGGGYYAHGESDPLDPEHRVFAFYRLADGARASTDVANHPNARMTWISADDALIDTYYRVDPRTLTFE